MRLWALCSFFDEKPEHLTEMVDSLAPLIDGIVAVDGPYTLYPYTAESSPVEQHAALSRVASTHGLELHIFTPGALTEVQKRAFMFEVANGVGVATAYEDWFLIIDGDMLLAPCDVAAVRAALEATEYDVAQDALGEMSYGSNSWNMNGTPLRSFYRAIPGLTVEGTHWLYVIPRPDGTRRFMWHGITKHGNPKEWAHPPEPALDLTDKVTLVHRQHQRSNERQRAREGYYLAREQHATERVPIYESRPPLGEP